MSQATARPGNSPSDPPMAIPRPTVKIFVRLTSTIPQYSLEGEAGPSEARLISFRIPEGLDSLALLDRGFAIDGNQAAFVVAFNTEAQDAIPFESPFGSGSTLMGALADSQKNLVKFLREHGFEPQFA